MSSTPEAVRQAANEIWQYVLPAIDHELRFPASSLATIESIITKHLPACGCRAEVEKVSR